MGGEGKGKVKGNYDNCVLNALLVLEDSVHGNVSLVLLVLAAG